MSWKSLLFQKANTVLFIFIWLWKSDESMVRSPDVLFGKAHIGTLPNVFLLSYLLKTLTNQCSVLSLSLPIRHVQSHHSFATSFCCHYFYSAMIFSFVIAHLCGTVSTTHCMMVDDYNKSSASLPPLQAPLQHLTCQLLLTHSCDFYIAVVTSKLQPMKYSS